MEKKKRPCPNCGSDNLGMCGDSHAVFSKDVKSVICMDCEMKGPTRVTEADAVKAWNDLPREMEWTWDRPVESGAYWYEETSGRPYGLRKDETTLADVNCEEGTVLLYAVDAVADLEELTGKWAGPLREPKGW